MEFDWELTAVQFGPTRVHLDALPIFGFINEQKETVRRSVEKVLSRATAGGGGKLSPNADSKVQQVRVPFNLRRHRVVGFAVKLDRGTVRAHVPASASHEASIPHSTKVPGNFGFGALALVELNVVAETSGLRRFRVFVIIVSSDLRISALALCAI